MNHISMRSALAAAILSFTTVVAAAADFRFNGSIDFSDPAGAEGTTFSGTFSLDLPTSDFTGNVSFTAFSFSFAGQTFTLNDASAYAYVESGQLGLLQYFHSAADGSTLDLNTGIPDGLQGTLNHTSAIGQFSSGSFQVTAVPEPESCALMLGGLGLVGWLARRSKAA